MRVVFFGTPAFAVPTLRALLASRHVVAGVVTQPDRPRGRGQKHRAWRRCKAARAAGLPVLQPERLTATPICLRALAALGADLGVVAAYGKILPEWLLALPPRGLINVHASLLPALARRRADPPGGHGRRRRDRRHHHARRQGARRRARCSPDRRGHRPRRDERRTRSALWPSSGPRLLVATLDRLAAGPVDETPQDEGRVTYAAKITRADSAVDWRAPARAVHDRIRGLHPWPHASAALAGARVILHRSQRLDAASDRPPATIVSAGAMGVDVATGDGGVVRLLELQAEGGRRLAAADFLAGRPLGPGMAFDLP